MNKVYFLLFIVSILIFSGCSRKSSRTYSNYNLSQVKNYSEDKNAYDSHLSEEAYNHPTMRSYTVFGKRYYPHSVEVGDKFRGYSSWYGPDFHGGITSNGERYNMYGMTAAHKTLPMNTMVKVTNRRNGLSAVVRINDRGPFVAGRIIDLSNSAARKIKMVGTGTAPVTIEVLGFYSKNKKWVPKKRKQKKIVVEQKAKVVKKQTLKNSTGTKFSLQIASFSNIEGALKIQSRYNNTDGYKTIIKDVDNENGRLFKVYLTGFKSEQEAREYKSHGKFQDSFIVREKKYD